MYNKIFEVLLIEIMDRIEMLSTALVKGSCPTIEEYRYICGQLRGLESACGIIKDLQQKQEEDFDE
jgi:hypothetical protein